jgi:hypothetical protein
VEKPDWVTDWVRVLACDDGSNHAELYLSGDAREGQRGSRCPECWGCSIGSFTRQRNCCRAQGLDCMEAINEIGRIIQDEESEDN